MYIITNSIGVKYSLIVLGKEGGGGLKTPRLFFAYILRKNWYVFKDDYLKNLTFYDNWKENSLIVLVFFISWLFFANLWIKYLCKLKFFILLVYPVEFS